MPCTELNFSSFLSLNFDIASYVSCKYGTSCPACGSTISVSFSYPHEMEREKRSLPIFFIRLFPTFIVTKSVIYENERLKFTSANKFFLCFNAQKSSHFTMTAACPKWLIMNNSFSPQTSWPRGDMYVLRFEQHHFSYCNCNNAARVRNWYSISHLKSCASFPTLLNVFSLEKTSCRLRLSCVMPSVYST